MMLRPSEICYTQDSIGKRFRNGKLISETLEDLCAGRCKIGDIPTISVKQESGKWRSVDNRRLWVFKQAELRGKCYEIPVNVIVSSLPPGKGSSTNDQSIRVRRDGPRAQRHRHKDIDAFERNYGDIVDRYENM